MMDSYKGESFLSFVVYVLSRGGWVEAGLYVMSRRAIYYDYLSLRSVILLYGCVCRVV
jgi:hypothetical protein